MEEHLDVLTAQTVLLVKDVGQLKKELAAERQVNSQLRGQLKGPQGHLPVRYPRSGSTGSGRERVCRSF